MRKESVDSEGAIADHSCSLEKSRKLMKIGEGNLKKKQNKNKPAKSKDDGLVRRMLHLDSLCNDLQAAMVN